jgi:hypothetical protein
MALSLPSMALTITSTSVVDGSSILLGTNNACAQAFRNQRRLPDAGACPVPATPHMGELWHQPGLTLTTNGPAAPTRNGRATLSPLPKTNLTWSYAAFFCCALALAHLARCAAAIFLRADADIVRLGFPAWPDFCFAHRARCAAAILLRPATEIVRFVFVSGLKRTSACLVLPVSCSRAFFASGASGASSR